MVELAPGARITVRQPNVRTRFIFTEGPKGDKGDPGDVPGTRTITAGTGLTGGGDLSANRTLSADPEYIRDTASDMLVAGSGVTLTKDDPGNTVTISASSGGGGGLLAYTIYNPTTPVTYASSTTNSDVDATNLAVTFTATSTSVLITLEATASRSSAGTGVSYWSLRNGTTNVPGSNRAVLGTIASTSAMHRVRTAIRVTGLTVGTAYTYKWAFRNSGSGNGQVFAGNFGGDEFSASTAYGPATMEVWAA